MPDLLIYSPYEKVNLELENLARERDIRVRATTDVSVASTWLNLRTFDLMFAHSSIDAFEQQDMANRLWNRNQAALYYMFDFEGNAANIPRVKLFGAQVASGADALDTLIGALDRLGRYVDDTEVGQFRIMLVEDLESPREIISIFLEQLGYPHVDARESATQAIAELERAPDRYSCVITDMRMPGMNGQQLIELIRKHRNLTHLPVIVLTAHGTVDALVDCLKAGASGFLVKPPAAKDLQHELGRAKRIAEHQLSPRLATDNEADSIRQILEDRDLV